jgi:hypothetical protein
VLIKLNYYGKIPCSCGGAIAHLSWTQHFFFNLFFIILSAIALYIKKKSGANPTPNYKISPA